MRLVKVFVGVILFVGTERATYIFSPSRETECNKHRITFVWGYLSKGASGKLQFRLSEDNLIATVNGSEFYDRLDMIAFCHKEYEAIVIAVKQVYTDGVSVLFEIILAEWVQMSFFYLALGKPNFEATATTPG
ncbi:hypothetical protein Tcan_04752 [Toxocara canis]|uniref:Uncharacterized protein n=1 Tax=Toxocara canis TaxID=6265 RepID=A0A0B2V9V6_TOXCA|nr:hypothetical protein Tcan_04752 [Toxocara canis]